MTDNPRYLECEECDDAPTVTGAWFNGHTWIDLCQECFDWWMNHGLVEAREVMP